MGAQAKDKPLIETMARFRFAPAERNRFTVYREHVEYYPVSETEIGEHIWAESCLGTTDKAGRDKLRRKMG